MGNVFSQFAKLTLIHRPGRKNNNVDPLSRLERMIPTHQTPLLDPALPIELREASEDVNSPAWRQIAYGKAPEAMAIDSIEANPDLITAYLEGYQKDSFFWKIIQELKETTDWSNPRHTLFFIGDNGLLYKYDPDGRPLLCVPKPVQVSVMEFHNELPEGAHFGFEKTYNLLSLSYYWPKMVKSIKAFQETCPVCQKIRSEHHSPFGYMQPIPIPQYPFQEVTMDFIMPLKADKGYDGIYVIVDRLSKWIVVRPVTTRITEEETAKLFKSMIINEHGLPEKVISDRDARWRETFWEQLLDQMGSKRALSTAHHPQTDGQTEAVNQILEIALRAFAQEGDWSDKLEDFQTAYNTSVHSGTGFTPYYVLYGKEMRKPHNILIDQSQKERTGLDKQSTALFLDRMEATWKLAKEALQFSQEVQRRSYNSNHTPIELEVGQLVLVNPHSLKLSGDWQQTGKKLLPKWEGPFEIIEKFGPNTYQIRLPPDWDIHPVLHVAHLKPYKSSPPEFGERPDISIRKRRETRLEDWEVERITAERLTPRKKNQKRKKLYKAIWKMDGILQETDEWIPSSNFKNAPEVVAQWKETLKLHPEKRAT
jgi:hypothetical protein